MLVLCVKLFDFLSEHSLLVFELDRLFNQTVQLLFKLSCESLFNTLALVFQLLNLPAQFDADEFYLFFLDLVVGFQFDVLVTESFVPVWLQIFLLLTDYNIFKSKRSHTFGGLRTSIERPVFAGGSHQFVFERRAAVFVYGRTIMHHHFSLNFSN